MLLAKPIDWNPRQIFVPKSMKIWIHHFLWLQSNADFERKVWYDVWSTKIHFFAQKTSWRNWILLESMFTGPLISGNPFCGITGRSLNFLVVINDNTFAEKSMKGTTPVYFAYCETWRWLSDGLGLLQLCRRRKLVKIEGIMKKEQYRNNNMAVANLALNWSVVNSFVNKITIRNILLTIVLII